MSYILDALKKSEQERKQGNVPNLQTIHIPVAVEQNTSPWLYAIIVFLLLSLAFVIGWMRPWEQQSAELVSESEPLLAIEPAPVTETVATLPVAEPVIDVTQAVVQTVLSPQQEIAKPRESSLVVENVSHDEPPSLALESAPHLSSMPQLIQQSIPSMTFAGHVYSSNISQRSIIINDHSLAEGDTIVAGLKIEQITPDGVVFSYQGQLFKMDVLQDWSFD